MSTSEDIAARRVVVIGGGIAALETVLALHDLADGRVRVTVIAPEADFTLRPLDVALPFGRGHSVPMSLDAFMTEHGGRFLRSAVLAIDSDARTVHCATGEDEPYDTLVVAVGATAHSPVKHAMTFGADPIALNGLLADLEQGYTRSVAFVVPERSSWPLPIYELALMTAEEAWSNYADDLDLHLVTPEPAPLDVFGAEASEAVAELLAAAKITLHAATTAKITSHGVIDLGEGDADLHVQRIVTLPVLEGPRFTGLPSDAHGFVPVDEHCRVRGCDDVYVVGDAADHDIKQGGLACQQADVAAAHIAAAAGADVEAAPYDPVLRGRLLTGDRDRFLRRKQGEQASEATTHPLWWPPAKVSSRYLAPYLEGHGLIELPGRDAAPFAPGVDVQLEPVVR